MSVARLFAKSSREWGGIAKRTRPGGAPIPKTRPPMPRPLTAILPVVTCRKGGGGASRSPLAPLLGPSAPLPGVDLRGCQIDPRDTRVLRSSCAARGRRDDHGGSGGARGTVLFMPRRVGWEIGVIGEGSPGLLPPSVADRGPPRFRIPRPQGRLSFSPEKAPYSLPTFPLSRTAPSPQRSPDSLPPRAPASTLSTRPSTTATMRRRLSTSTRTTRTRCTSLP